MAEAGLDIRGFYDKSGILVTGATGFLGKILIEKLLRSCKSLDTLYLLIRPKKGKAVAERLKELFSDIVFSEMKKSNPEFLNQLRIVEGDCAMPRLGLSDDDYALLQDKVNIVFHGAATVRFDENLKLAVSINTSGTKEILDLCKTMNDLKALVHISTAYSNCYAQSIKEAFYEPPSCHNYIMQMAATSTPEEMDQQTPSVIENWPNTYTMTKALAENLIKEEQGVLPASVFRPAIVTSTYKEPLHGWIDNMYGPTGVVIGAQMGVLRVLQADGSVEANLVPVDYTVNALLASAVETAQRFRERKDSELKVYNYVSSTDNPINYAEFMKELQTCGITYPSNKCIWYYYLILTKSYFSYLFLTVLLHFLPGLIIDTVSILLRKKPRMVKTYQKIHKFVQTIAYFSTRRWFFRNDNVVSLWGKLSDEEKKEFPFDIKSLDWVEYLSNYVRGTRAYFLKESEEQLPAARRRWNRLYWIHQFVRCIIVGIGVKLIWSCVSLVV